MKKIFLWALFLAPLSMQAQSGEGNAKTRKVNGFDIYVYSEPVKDYKEAFELKNITLGAEISIDDAITNFAKDTRKKNEKAAKKNEPQASAIIVYDTRKASAVYFEK